MSLLETQSSATGQPITVSGAASGAPVKSTCPEARSRLYRIGRCGSVMTSYRDVPCQGVTHVSRLGTSEDEPHVNVMAPETWCSDIYR